MNNLYETCLAIARMTAKSYGFAIGLHGTGQRDLDLIAVPWTDHASIPPSALAGAIMQAINFHFGGEQDKAWCEELEPDVKKGAIEKPHGRLAYIIHLGPILNIDLSIFPAPRV